MTNDIFKFFSSLLLMYPIFWQPTGLEPSGLQPAAAAGVHITLAVIGAYPFIYLHFPGVPVIQTCLREYFLRSDMKSKGD